MQTPIPAILFTDMDGTLLDHYTYSFEPAADCLRLLDKHHIPVVPVSSKTKAELFHLRTHLSNEHPFIVENGAAVYIPEGYFAQQPKGTELIDTFWVKSFVKPRQHWQKLLDSLSSKYSGDFTSFDQIGIQGIIDMTSLDYDSAVRASQRQFGEPLAWYGSTHKKQLFIDDLTAQGAQVLQGGRFMHISGQCDKGKALRWLTDIYQNQQPNSTFTTIAAGDSHNDQAMLEVADIAVIIKSPTHDYPTLMRTENCYFSNEFGPEGWSNTITRLLNSLNISTS